MDSFNNRAWSQLSAEVVSPDGKCCARIAWANEIAMGGPTFGTLEVCEKAFESCNPCMVWSEDSKYLAVAQLHARPTLGRGSCRILVFAVESGRDGYGRQDYMLPCLQEFSKGVITGISLGKQGEPRTFRIPLDTISWQDPDLPM